MKYPNVTAAGLLAFLCLAGCNNAKSPDAVADDTAAAQQKADAKVADAQNDAMKDNANMQAKLDDRAVALTNTEAKGAYDVALKQADGAHEVALNKCNAYGGDAQKKCKDQADADYEAEKAAAKSAEVAKTQ